MGYSAGKVVKILSKFCEKSCLLEAGGREIFSSLHVLEDVLDLRHEHPDDTEGKGQRRNIAALLHEDDGLPGASGFSGQLLLDHFASFEAVPAYLVPDLIQ